MRKAIGMSGLLAAILAAGPVSAQNAPRRDGAIVFMPDGTVLTDESTQIGQMRQLTRQITGQVQLRISRELQSLRTPCEIVEASHGFPRADPDLRPFLIPVPILAHTRPHQKKPPTWASPLTPVSARLSTISSSSIAAWAFYVVFVERGSPAAEAGLLQNDVLEKLDDQLLVNTAQFTVLVRSKKPGDEVTLSVIRAPANISPRGSNLLKRKSPSSKTSAPFRISPQFVPIPGPGAT